MVRLTQDQRNAAVQMLLRGTSQAVITRNFQVGKSTITRNRFRTAVERAQVTPGTHNNRISADTVRNRLREFGLRPRRPYVGMLLTQRRRQVRMAWLTQHRPNLFPLRQWRNVMFSDESRYLLYRPDGRQRVYRRNGERYRDNCLVERDRFGGGALMVWAGISYGHRTPLVFIDGPLTAQLYVDVILRPVVVPFVRQHNVTFQQDNARAHVARLSMAFLQQNNVNVMHWPPYSPDLCPIEHLWDVLDRRVRNRLQPPTTLQTLRLALMQEWNAIHQAEINRLILSMTRRLHWIFLHIFTFKFGVALLFRFSIFQDRDFNVTLA